MKIKRGEKPLLFVVPGVLLILAGFSIMISFSLGERLGSVASSSLSFAAALAAVGAMLLTRTLLSVFFLFIFSVVVVFFGIREYGILNPVVVPFVVLILLCLPMAKYARR